MIRWFYLDDQHADYADIIADLQSFGGDDYENVAGRDANRRVVKTNMTDAEVSGNTPTLAIGAANCVKDHLSYKNVEFPFDVTTENLLTIGGYSRTTYGKLKNEPTAIQNRTRGTAGIDRLVAWLKGGTETVLYVSQSGRGSVNGADYLNARPIKDILAANDPSTATDDPTQYSIIVLADDVFSRFNDEGTQNGLTDGSGFFIRSGTINDRTILTSHPEHNASLMGGCKLGSGSWGEAASWTDNADGTWTIDVGTTVNLHVDGFVISNDSGTLIALTKVADLATCQSTNDSYFVEQDHSGGSNDRITVHLASGNDPKNTTYVAPASSGGIELLTAETRYFDLYGISLWQQHLSGTQNIYNSDYDLFACVIKYIKNKSIGANHETVGEGTGFFVNDSGQPAWPHRALNRNFYGILFDHCGDGFYDYGAGHYHVSENTRFYDSFATAIGKDEFGINLGNSDSHSWATMGHRGDLLYSNCGMDDISWHTLHTAYATSQNAATPDAPDTAINDASWTDQSTGDGSITDDGAGNITLVQGSTGVGIVQQEITIAVGDQGKVHVLEFTADAAVDVDVGSTAGGSEIVDSATAWASNGGNGLPTYIDPPSWADGWDAKWSNIRRVRFTPNTGTIFVRIQGRGTSNTITVTSPDFIDLETTEGYTLGFPSAKRKLYSSGTLFYFNTPVGNPIVEDCWIRNPITFADNSALTDTGRAIQMGGDNFVFGIEGSGLIGKTIVRRNIIQGAYTEAIVTQYIPSSLDYKDVDINQNIIEEAIWAFYAFGNATGIDDGGDEWDPYFWFHHNLLHNTTTREVVDSNVLDTHKQIFDFNHYSFTTSHIATPWQTASGSNYTSLGDWQAAAPANDNYDDNSTVGQDLDLPSLPALIDDVAARSGVAARLVGFSRGMF